MLDQKQSQSRGNLGSNIASTITTMTLLLLTCWLLLTNLGQSAIPLATIPAKVDFILENTPLTDTHNDLPIKLLQYFKNKISYQDLETLPKAAGFEGFDTDLGRLKKVCECLLIHRVV
jgi:hypothetical protein